jgi:alpha-tubulin suppressor-like RCC1 family protein
VSGWVPALLQREWRDSLEMGTVAAGDSPHSLSFDANGALMVCGFEDEHGTLGLPRNQEESEDEDDELRTVLVPTPVRFMSGMRIRKVVAGLKCSLAVGEAGRVYMWGAGSRGRLATDRQDRLVPTLIQELRHHRVRHVATAWDICAAVTEEGLLFTWATAWRRGLLADVEDEAADEAALGRPRLGLGVDGSTINNPWPPQCVMALKKKRVGSVAVGRQFTLVTTEAGVVYSFGDGTRGSLGLGDYETHILPKRVQALDGVHMAAVAAAWFQSLALTASGRVFWWGGRRLTTTTEFEWQSIPQLVDSDFGAGRVRGIAANSLSAYAVTDAGVLFSWESDSCAHACSLPLNGNCQVQLSPWPVAGLHGITVVGVSAGELHALVLAADGSVYAFGRGKALGIGWGVGGSGYPAGLQGDPADEAEGQMILAEAGERMKLTPKKVPGLVCKERRTFPARPGRRVLL